MTLLIAIFVSCFCYFSYVHTHCSAGVGRTGTLITIDRVLDQLQKESVVDIAGTICSLRIQRMKMVQNLVCMYNPFRHLLL